MTQCVGVRFFVGKLIERAYSEAILSRNESYSTEQGRLTTTLGIEALRKSLGHPLLSLHPIRCIVASTNGMDAESLGDRAIVASVLWSAGIATEYLPQSGVMMSLVRKSGAELTKMGALASVSEVLRFCFVTSLGHWL